MTTFISILGWLLAVIWALLTIFVYICGKDEKKHRDGSWKLFIFGSTLLLLTAIYCAISAHLLH